MNSHGDDITRSAPGPDSPFAEVERVSVRRIRSGDERKLAEMLAQASPEDIRFRCFGAIKDFPHTLAARLSRIDPRREATLVAVAGDGTAEAAGTEAILGVVHIVCEGVHPDTAEFDIMTRPDQEGHGLGYGLMQEILGEARRRGLRAAQGYILRDNRTMLIMARELGFVPVMDDDDMVCMRAELGRGRTL